LKEKTVLDRRKVARELSLLVDKLFPDICSQSDMAQKKWHDITKDDTFAHRADVSQSSFLIPRWDGNLSDVQEIKENLEPYTVISVDGSQIYPDRHISGAGCFLINTGGIVLRYGSNSCVEIFSEPHILLPTESEFTTKEFVDFKREEFELSTALRKSQENIEYNPVCLIDGSIIFWQLESKSKEQKKIFLDSYLKSLDGFYKKNILVAGYISMPKSRELVNLIKLGLCRFSIADCIACHKAHEDFPCKWVDKVLDTHVARFFLPKKFRTTVFYSTSKIVRYYPSHLRPAFVYCDVGSEIVRIELPSWIAQNKTLLDRMCVITLDQVKKGGGYPVCLAEAHEQAVVKGGDRDFFYHLLHKIGIDQNRHIKLSQKAMKKRSIGI
jgi:hypothetical protein